MHSVESIIGQSNTEIGSQPTDLSTKQLNSVPFAASLTNLENFIATLRRAKTENCQQLKLGKRQATNESHENAKILSPIQVVEPMEVPNTVESMKSLESSLGHHPTKKSRKLSLNSQGFPRSNSAPNPAINEHKETKKLTSQVYKFTG